MTTEEVQAINRKLAEEINLETLKNPSSQYAGKFVGIANGKVMFVGDDGHTVSRRMREIEPNHLRVFLVEASRDYDEVQYVWRV